MAKAIAFATSPRCHPAKPGAKAPGQYPCSSSGLYGSCFLPFPVFAQECVGEDEEFAHRGDEGEFGGFSGGAQAGEEGCQVTVPADGGQGWHGESAAQMAPAALNGGFSPRGSALAGDGCQPCQGGDLAGLELAKLGGFGEECRGGEAQRCRAGFAGCGPCR